MYLFICSRHVCSTDGDPLSLPPQDLDWEVVVINSPDTNAGALPGGKFVVFTGLLRLLDDEDELAAVIAHEVAHVVARHHVRRRW